MFPGLPNLLASRETAFANLSVDAAGNMNNVYTAPPAPVVESTPAPAAAAVAPTAVPPATTSDKPTTTAKETEPSTLLAASAPAPASTGSPYILGGVATSSSAKTPVVPVAATEVTPTPVLMEKTAASTPVGEAGTGQTASEVAGDAIHSISAQAAAYGTAALGAIGAIAGTAAAAVEKATGVDLTHVQPVGLHSVVFLHCLHYLFC